MPTFGSARMIKTVSLLTFEQMLNLAKEYIPDAWLIAESSQGSKFGPMREYANIHSLIECERITLFGKNGEMRMKKAVDSNLGRCVVLMQAKEASEFAISQLARILQMQKN